MPTYTPARRNCWHWYTHEVSRGQPYQRGEIMLPNNAPIHVTLGNNFFKRSTEALQWKRMSILVHINKRCCSIVCHVVSQFNRPTCIFERINRRQSRVFCQFNSCHLVQHCCPIARHAVSCPIQKKNVQAKPHWATIFLGRWKNYP